MWNEGRTETKEIHRGPSGWPVYSPCADSVDEFWNIPEPVDEIRNPDEILSERMAEKIDQLDIESERHLTQYEIAEDNLIMIRERLASGETINDCARDLLIAHRAVWAVIRDFGRVA